MSRPKTDTERGRAFVDSLRHADLGPLGDELVLNGGRGYPMEVYEIPRERLTREFMRGVGTRWAEREEDAS